MVQLLRPLNHFNYFSWSLAIFWWVFIQSPFFYCINCLFWILGNMKKWNLILILFAIKLSLVDEIGNTWIFCFVLLFFISWIMIRWRQLLVSRFLWFYSCLYSQFFTLPKNIFFGYQISVNSLTVHGDL